MCGIVGFNWEDKELIRKMTDSLISRGPDQEGILCDKGISLGHRRLSIIDLSEKGRQPMCSDDGTLWIIFNGEIYNYKELKVELQVKGHKFRSQSDTEVIIYAYKEYGDRCVDHLNGDFAFAIYDVNNKKIFVARDRLGVKPLYYYNKDGKFIFASEIKAILQESSIDRRVNIEALNRYVSYRYSFGEQTLFEDIQVLRPGHYLVYDLRHNFLYKTKYWDIKLEPQDKGERYFVDKIRELFKDSVARRLMSDVPLGVFLSGGIDSSAIVAMMSQLNLKEPIKTFSVGFGYGEETDELSFAKKVSEEFKTDHQEFIVEPDILKVLPEIVWHTDEPLADPALIPIYYLSQNAKKKATVILTGDGGDELFSGYAQSWMLPLIKKTRFVPFRKTLASFALKTMPAGIKNKVFKYSESLGEEGVSRALSAVKNSDNDTKLYEEVVALFNEEEKQELLQDKTRIINLNRKFQGKNLLDKITFFELKYQLPDNMLMKSDKMTMAHAVEGRVPFLDHRLVELSTTIPNKLKVQGRNGKYIFKKAMKGIVPDPVINRKKQRFYVPIDKWMKEDLKPLVEEVLNKQTIERQGFFNPVYVQKIFDKFDKSPLFYARQAWVLLTFQMWYKKYFEETN